MGERGGENVGYNGKTSIVPLILAKIVGEMSKMIAIFALFSSGWTWGFQMQPRVATVIALCGGWMVGVATFGVLFLI